MTNDFIVSIIIPTYNRSALLAEAIQSCINQTYRPIECIIVDDGSTDDTKEIVTKIENANISLFTVKYIFQQNAGSQVARNTGMAAATGEFIQYLDSDDLLYPDKIANQVNYFNQHPDCEAVFGDWEKGTIDVKEKVVAYESGDLIAQFLTEKCIANFAMLMREQLVKKIGDWDVNIKRNQEIDFHLRGVLAGGKFEYQPGVCGLWRTHEEERIANSSGFSSAIRFYKKWENILREKKIWDQSMAEGINKNYMWFLGNYPTSSDVEMKKLLLEMIRLQPDHPNFNSFKFKACCSLLGKNRTLDFWIYRYKARQQSNK